MILKIVGSVVVLLCGAFYAKLSQREVKEELLEAEYLLDIFKHLKNEIEEFDTPVYTVLKSHGVDGGADRLLSGVKSEKLRTAIYSVKKLGYGYKKEELRVCDRLISNLEVEKNRLDAKVKEAKAMSKVKGIGVAAAAVILFI